MNRTIYLRIGKRVLDLLITLPALLVLAPLLCILAVWIKLDSSGPIFFTQERVGRGGRCFRLIKFRSMVVGAETKGAGILVEKNDLRITRSGAILRRTSMDELPQLINVLRGEMSLVGPRPTLRYQVEQYDAEQRRRLLVPPGLTGWAQVNGRKSLDWPSRIRLDLEYLDRVSLLTDLGIMFRTLPVVLGAEDPLARNDPWKGETRTEEKADRSAGGAVPPTGED